MDQQDLKDLFRAAKHGDIVSFKSLLNYDPLLLDKVDLLSCADTPLHIAALSGRTKFVEELVLRKASFAWHLNEAGFCPLHIASALGHLEIAKELLNLGLDLCLLLDGKGQTALHHAAINGRVDIIAELLKHSPEALNEVTAGGDTAFHLAIKSRQLKALSLLLSNLRDNGELLNKKNKQGFTVFRLAESRNLVITSHMQGLGFQFSVFSSPNCIKNEEQELEMLKNEGDTQGRKDKSRASVQQMNPQAGKIASILIRILRKSYGFDEEAIQVIAVLLVTMTYQGALTPPESIWKKNMKLDYKCLLRNPFEFFVSFHSPPPDHCPTYSFLFFMFFNTFGFFCSLMLLLLFKRGSSAQRLMVLSLFSLLMSYLFLLGEICPDSISFLIFGAPAVPLVLLLYIHPLRMLFARISTFKPNKAQN